MAPPAPAGQWFPIGFAAGSLWFKYFMLQPTTRSGWLDKDKVTSIDLAPGEYTYWTGSGQFPVLKFQVTATGTVQYDPVFASFVSGAGSSTLTITGVPVSIDASRLLGTGVLLAESSFAGAPQGGWIHDQQVRLLPQDDYALVSASGMVSTFRFAIGTDGKVTYDASWDVSDGGMAAGNGTSALRLLGYPVCVDARPSGATGPTSMLFGGGNMSVHAAGPLQLGFLMPASGYRLTVAYPDGAGAHCLTFDIADNGTIAPPGGNWPPYLALAATADYPLLSVTQEHPCS